MNRIHNQLAHYDNLLDEIESLNIQTESAIASDMHLIERMIQNEEEKQQVGLTEAAKKR